jgi:hypothetical protein
VTLEELDFSLYFFLVFSYARCVPEVVSSLSYCALCRNASAVSDVTDIEHGYSLVLMAMVEKTVTDVTLCHDTLSALTKVSKKGAVISFRM